MSDSTDISDAAVSEAKVRDVIKRWAALRDPLQRALEFIDGFVTLTPEEWGKLNPKLVAGSAEIVAADVRAALLGSAALSAARPHLVTDSIVEKVRKDVLKVVIDVVRSSTPATLLGNLTAMANAPAPPLSAYGLSASDALAPAVGQPVEIKVESQDNPAWLIRKSGYFYRPNRAGYTTRKAEAGRYTREDGQSEHEVEPHNISAILASEVPDDPTHPFAAPIPERVNAMDLREAAHLAHTAGMTAPTVKEHDDLFEEASVLSRAADWLDRFAHLPRDRKGETDAARDVLAERWRQVEAEGWTPAHDDKHSAGEMGYAAMAYITNSAVAAQMLLAGMSPQRVADRAASCPVTDLWPWGSKWWKPSGPRRDLVKAGALILAEIERLDRAALRKEPSAPGEE